MCLPISLEAATKFMPSSSPEIQLFEVDVTVNCKQTDVLQVFIGQRPNRGGLHADCWILRNLSCSYVHVGHAYFSHRKLRLRFMDRINFLKIIA